MNKKNEKLYFNPTKGLVSVSEMVAEIASFVDKEPSRQYRVIIGTDSHTRKVNRTNEIDFVTAIIVHRLGRGGRYFWKKEKRRANTLVLRDKIYTETLMSLNVAQEIVPEIRRLISPGKYDLEIHIDVGPLGPTREMIREVVGIVNGNGFVAKTKPNSWGASKVADKHT